MKEEPWTSSHDISTSDALRLAREIIERVGEGELRGILLLNRCREIITLGCEAYRDANNSVTLLFAITKSLQERAERRARTRYELRNICTRLLHANPEMAKLQLRHLCADQCREALERVFRSKHQFIKARAVLHSVFACAQRHGWCVHNPVDAIPRPELHEAEVAPMGWQELRRLLATAAQAEHRCCMPALGLMLWAGVRPAEVTRLHWEDIDWQEKVISLRPRHSKTGGARHVTLYPVLMAWLRSARASSGSICPPNWPRRWKALRRAAGIAHWQQDVLRHTFASYHLKRWHDLPRLQEEMGHRSTRLLRTRYLSMRGITTLHARLFWTPGKL